MPVDKITEFLTTALVGLYPANQPAKFFYPTLVPVQDLKLFYMSRNLSLQLIDFHVYLDFSSVVVRKYYSENGVREEEFL